MAIHLQLPTEVEHHLRAKAAQLGQTLEKYLEEVAFRDVGVGNGAPTRSQADLTPDERIALWLAWTSADRRLPTGLVVDDSRESIYAGQLDVVHARCSELRFGQLIATIGMLAEDETGHSLWDVEDADFAAALARFTADMERRESGPALESGGMASSLAPTPPRQVS